jgi:hypothetical protein
MPRRPASVIVAAALLLLAPLGAPALAAPGDDTAPRSPERLAEDDCRRARARHQPCVLTMDAEALEGGAARAEGSAVTARTHATFTSLIRIRADFRAEILRAAEDIP